MRCITSQTVKRFVFGFQLPDSSSRFPRPPFPAFDTTRPACSSACTAVFLAFESVSARPYSPAFMAYSSNQATAQRVSASYSPSCSASASSSARLINCSAVRGAGRARRRERRGRSEEHTSELQSHLNLLSPLLLEKKNHNHTT